MTDWENPEVIIHAGLDPPWFGPPPPPPLWRRVASGAAQIAGGAGHALRVTLLQVAPLLLLGVVGWVVVTELLNHRVEIAPISVPPGFAQQGITPEGTARRLLDEIDLMQRRTSTTMKRADAALAGEAADFSVPGVGMSLSSVVHTLRGLVGVPSPRVTGEINLVGQAPAQVASMRLRLPGQEPVTVSVTAESGDDAFAELVRRGARELLMRTHPYIVVARDYEDQRDPLVVLELARRVEVWGIGPAETRVRAINLQGVILQTRLNQPLQAMVEYRRALRADPGFAVAHDSLGTVLQQLNRPQEAEASYREALRLDPRHARAHSNLGALLQTLNRGGEAEASFRNALRIDPRLAGVHYNLAIVLVGLGRREEAEEDYRQALRLDPRDADAHYNLAQLLEALDRRAEAHGHARQALAISDTPEARDLVQRLEQAAAP